jgi:hypothetical protein
MPGTLTIARRSIATRNQPVRKYTFAWTSDASGAVSGTLSEFISGTIVGVDFIPGAERRLRRNAIERQRHRRSGRPGSQPVEREQVIGLPGRSLQGRHDDQHCAAAD